MQSPKWTPILSDCAPAGQAGDDADGAVARGRQRRRLQDVAGDDHAALEGWTPGARGVAHEGHRSVPSLPQLLEHVLARVACRRDEQREQLAGIARELAMPSQTM